MERCDYCGADKATCHVCVRKVRMDIEGPLRALEVVLCRANIPDESGIVTEHVRAVWEFRYWLNEYLALNSVRMDHESRENDMGQLFDRIRRLGSEPKYDVVCPTCGGSGLVPNVQLVEPSKVLLCRTCKGEGWLSVPLSLVPAFVGGSRPLRVIAK